MIDISFFYVSVLMNVMVVSADLNGFQRVLAFFLIFVKTWQISLGSIPGCMFSSPLLPNHLQITFEQPPTKLPFFVRFSYRHVREALG